MTGPQRIRLANFFVIWLLLLGFAAPGEATPISGDFGHQSTYQVISHEGVHHTGTSQSTMHHAKFDGDAGGCPMGLAGPCCVMTCCSATTPEIMSGEVHHLVTPAGPSRLTVRRSRVIIPPLKPPIRVS